MMHQKCEYIPLFYLSLPLRKKMHDFLNQFFVKSLYKLNNAYDFRS